MGDLVLTLTSRPGLEEEREGNAQEVSDVDEVRRYEDFSTIGRIDCTGTI